MIVGKVEKNVPIPAGYTKYKFPWAKMEVGDSVLIKVGENEGIKKMRSIIRRSGRYYGEKTNKKFRFETNPERTAVRIWRTE